MRERCQLNRETFEIFGSLLAWFDEQAARVDAIFAQDVPATFKPAERP